MLGHTRAVSKDHTDPFTEASIPDLTGTVAVVTGANGGLGLETARALAAKGPGW